ncbi:hypothetical protein Ciccas_007310 [Cichlidogyrus casuarinus]|uniref:HAT C-terminal dimerisation domain-containing protein n=1 Tax=Cichlidogyrus casuarinus TaxID=1844966 RepID=A0ABD2Q3E9_9PLAT
MVDIWTCKKDFHILAISAAVDYKEQMTSVLLSFRRLLHPSTATYISAVIENELEKHKIASKINFIITDNASYFVKGLQDMNQSQWPDFGTDSDSEPSDWGDESNVNSHPEMLSHFYSQRLSCFLHTLDLAHKDAERDTPSFQMLVQHLKTILKACKRNYIRNLMCETYGENFALRSPTEVRWNSKYSLLKSIIAICIRLREMSQNDIHQTTRNFITALETSLKDRFSGVFDLIRGVPKSLSEADTRFGHPIYVLATVLNPRIRLFDNFVNKVANITSQNPVLVKSRLKSACIIALNAFRAVFEPMEAGPPVKKNCKDFSLLEEFFDEEEDNVSRLNAEFEDYISSSNKLCDQSVLEFWRDQKSLTLSRIALEVLKVPESSASVESVFSTASHVQRANRSKMLTKTVARAVMLKKNEFILE